VTAPGYAAEVQRQMQVVAEADQQDDTMVWLDETRADWWDEE
jgi:hypothetical protein